MKYAAAALAAILACPLPATAQKFPVSPSVQVDCLMRAIPEETRNAPARPRAAHRPAVQRGDQARADERGLAAARGADDREQTSRAQAAEQFVDLCFASEKEMIFVWLERPQPRKRIERQLRRHQPRPASPPRMRSMKGASDSGEKVGAARMTNASWVRKRSFSAVSGGTTHTATTGAGLVRP